MRRRPLNRRSTTALRGLLASESDGGVSDCFFLNQHTRRGGGAPGAVRPRRGEARDADTSSDTARTPSSGRSGPASSRICSCASPGTSPDGRTASRASPASSGGASGSRRTSSASSTRVGQQAGGFSGGNAPDPHGYSSCSHSRTPRMGHHDGKSPVSRHIGAGFLLSCFGRRTGKGPKSA